MKRHPSLQELSREHHLMLLHVRELRWASKGNGDLVKACRDFLDYWKKRGGAHFKQEEEKLFPFCERCQDWKKTEAVQLVFKQHEEIQLLIRELEVLVTAGKGRASSTLRAAWRLETCLTSVSSHLGTLLDRHIRHEERVVFEQIQDALSEHEMENLGKYLN